MNHKYFNYWVLAFFAGVLLTFMIKYNSQLAMYSSPLFASFVAHGIGTIFALLILIGSNAASTSKPPKVKKVRLWAYLGGVPGAFIVLLSAIVVNSELGLSGSLSLMLLGQMTFSLACEHYGFFNLPKNPATINDIIIITIVFIGCVLIIYAGNLS